MQAEQTDTEFDLTFASAFKITNRALLITGSHPSIKRNARWMVHYAAGMTLTHSMSYLIIYSMLHAFEMRRWTDACKYGTLLIVCFIISFKYVILLLYQADTMEMIRIMERDYERARSLSREERRIVRHYAERGAGVTRLWFGVAVGTGSLFPLQAICLMIYYAAVGGFQKVPVFGLVLPFFDEYKFDNALYIPIFVMTSAFAAYAATMYMSFDPLVPIFMLHCCGQLELANIQILQLFPEEADPAATRDKLKNIITHLQQVYNFVDIAKRDFTIVYEMILKATTILIPITLMQIIQSLKDKTPSLEFISFLFGCLVHFYIPCYYGDLLLEKSLTVVGALYSCGWETRARGKIRRDLVFMLARANRPLALTTAFQTICLDSFTEMCRQSYGIFNLMNAAVE